MKRHALGMLAILSLLASAVSAETVSWNTWSSSSAGQIDLNGTTIDVGFDTSNTHSWESNYPSWTPSATFADGTIVANGPVAANGIMRLIGGTNALNTLTFSTPVDNPVMAIWSLGSGALPASFVFDGATPTFVSGGGSAEYGGAAIVVNGNTVSGNEGNGTILFQGRYTELVWTNPSGENWYGFNVGVMQPVPEPSQMALFGVGIGLLLLLSAGRGKRDDDAV